MNVLGLCSYPVEAAATRYRLAQYVEPLAAKGIHLSVSPFLDGENFERLYRQGNFLRKSAEMLPPILKRVKESFDIRRFDLLFVQREAAIFGPAIFEILYQTIGKMPLVLDLDDATYVRYVSPTYGRLGSFFKFFGKTDNLIRRAETVVCGNRLLPHTSRKKAQNPSSFRRLSIRKNFIRLRGAARFRLSAGSERIRLFRCSNRFFPFCRN